MRTLAELARDPRFKVDPAALDLVADTAARYHAALECLVLRLGGPAMIVDAFGGLHPSVQPPASEDAP
jgi:hypothetical protein